MLRDLVPPDDADFVADPPEDLRAPLERVEPAAEDFARDVEALRPPELLAREVDDLAREPPDREELERLLAALRPLVPDEDPREDVEEPELPLLLAPLLSPPVHLPESTRCAASATASAIKVPSLVALVITLLAA